jgi:hypothetical protein
LLRAYFGPKQLPSNYYKAEAKAKAEEINILFSLNLSHTLSHLLTLSLPSHLLTLSLLSHSLTSLSLLSHFSLTFSLLTDIVIHEYFLRPWM